VLGKKLQMSEATINIVGYKAWYSESPWNRGLATNRPFKVTFDKLDENNITYFIRDGIYQVDNIESDIKVALLTECRPFDVQDRYGFVEKNNKKFDYIVTYDNELLSKFPNKGCPTPEGGTWVWPEYVQKIYPKNKLCSYVVSNKNHTREQKLRVQLLKYFYDNRNKYRDIGLYGRGHNPFPENHDFEFDGKRLILKDYAFSITLENWIQDNYFSEKIMDCFMLGTVPIYMGARDIGKYFNLDGVILVESVEDILNVLPTLSMKKYKHMLPAIKENFELAKNHYDTVNYSYNTYIKRKINNEA